MSRKTKTKLRKSASKPVLGRQCNAGSEHRRYIILAQRASEVSDRVSAENFYQHAEHYLKLINAQQNVERSRRNPPKVPDSQVD